MNSLDASRKRAAQRQREARYATPAEKRQAAPWMKSALKRKSAKQGAKDREWSKVTKARIATLGGGCEAYIAGVCTFNATDGHHMLKRSRGGLNNDDNCITVCRACHSWLETHDKQACEMGLSYKRHNAPASIGGTASPSEVSVGFKIDAEGRGA